MRAMILTVAALAACSSADTVAGQKVQLFDPVPAAAQSDYASYRVAREAVLMGQAAMPATIPVALPVQAPTAADIAPAPRVATKPAPKTAAAGTAGYPRQNVSGAEHLQACGRFYTDQAAQEAFLRAGGPQKDPAGLDPDGDGYACGYRPQTGL